MAMSKIINQIPNLITFFRLLLSIVFVIFICIYVKTQEYLLTNIIIFLIICFTDFFDGKIARYLKIDSFFGGIFDVIIDLIYIILSYTILCLNNIMLWWFFIIVILKFIEFTITSLILRRRSINASSSLFIFDVIGRITSVAYFIMPGIAIFLNHITSDSLTILNYICIVITILSVISSIQRIICGIRYNQKYFF